MPYASRLLNRTYRPLKIFLKFRIVSKKPRDLPLPRNKEMLNVERIVYRDALPQVTKFCEAFASSHAAFVPRAFLRNLSFGFKGNIRATILFKLARPRGFEPLTF